MVAARRRFLDAGHFAPIADNASRFAMEFVRSRSAGASCLIVDAGCGEGTYLAAIAERLSAERLRVALAGIDISKWAIQAASKRTSSCFWAVGTNRHLPFAPGSVDLICSMFGFPVWDAFAGLQQAGGRVLLVDPGPDHLIELREIIYPSVLRSQPGSLAAAALAGYRLDWEERQQFQFQLDEPALIADLLSMTPHNHRAPLAGRQALAALNSLMVSADVVFRCLSRTDG